jgi:hypothetical protein
MDILLLFFEFEWTSRAVRVHIQSVCDFVTPTKDRAVYTLHSMHNCVISWQSYVRSLFKSLDTDNCDETLEVESESFFRIVQ